MRELRRDEEKDLETDHVLPVDPSILDNRRLNVHRDRIDGRDRSSSRLVGDEKRFTDRTGDAILKRGVNERTRISSVRRLNDSMSCKTECINSRIPQVYP